MVYGQRPMRGAMGAGGMGSPFSGRPSEDVIALVAVVFFTFALQFFSSTAIIPFLLHLSPLVWRSGFLWQLVTYPFAGHGPASFWILLELLILFWFARDVFNRLGRQRFWKLLATGAAVAAVAAVAVELLVEAFTGAPFTLAPFQLMQGQRLLLVILLVAFATVYGDATIYLFFVLPVPARWLVWLGVLFGFVAFLSTKDLAGFVGICAATAFTYRSLSRGRGGLRHVWLRLRQRWTEARLALLRRRSRFRIVPPDDDEDAGPTIN